MTAGSYPVWVTGGARHVHLPTGAWDGSGAARVYPPTQAQAYSSVGAFSNLSRRGALVIRSLVVPFEVRLGPTYVAGVMASGGPKFLIVHASSAPDGEVVERPMTYMSAAEGCATYNVAAATVQQHIQSGSPEPDWWPSGREAFAFCDVPQPRTKPVVLPGEWVSIGLLIVAESRPAYPDGAIRTIVTRRDGTVLLDYAIPWNFDTSWSLPRYITEVQLVGGYYNAGVPASSGNYIEIAGLTFAANRAEPLGPRAGFVD